MDPFWQILGGGGLFLGLAAILTVYATRRRDRSTDVQERFKQNLELTKYINTLISEATTPLKTEIAGLRTDLAALKTRDDAIKNILRSFFQRLLFWDQHERPGDMPMPSREDMDKLDLDLDIEAHEQFDSTPTTP